MEKQIILLDEKDQNTIHERIYQIKNHAYSDKSNLIFLKKLMIEYKTDSLMVGCTEMHLFNKCFLSEVNSNNHIFLEPLTIFAKNLKTNVLNTQDNKQYSQTVCG